MSDQELNDLLKSFDNPNHCYQQRLVDAIRLLVKERDEARRMYCEEVEHHHETVWNNGERDFKPLPALDVAKQNGWDCYKEDGKQS